MLAYLWVPRETKVYELASVVSEDASSGNVTVRSVDDGIMMTLPKSQTRVADSSHFGDFDDLCFMNNLHEAPLLYMLKRRLENDKIYTNTGNILISMNPYKRIAGLYDDPLRYLDLPDDDDTLGSKYQSQEKSSDLPPHVNAIANSSLRALIISSEVRNQSIIVSGESGAGKTEASKLVMNFLIASNDYVCKSGRKASLMDVGERIKQVLVESNVVFESFGNSKTVRNDNSSRFGKYIKLQYTSDNQLLSAYTETFLLEKSRLVSVGKDERNYHIFYQLVRGFLKYSPTESARLHLESVDQFSILIDGQCTVIVSVEKDEEDFAALSHALTTLGCSQQEMTCIYELLACILHLGNADCTAGKEEGAVCEMTCPTMALDQIATILGIPLEELLRGTLTHRLQAARRGSVHMKVLSVEDAKNNISGLIKWLYRSLFSWLVLKVNYAHGSSAASTHRKVVKFIGILDIFGFEILGVNSFEQLCINFANERLQQQFNEHVFVLEQQEYAKEGLDWASVSFRDNQNVIDLISKKPTGLLSILEEHSMLNRKPDDGKLLGSFNQTHDRINDAFLKARFGNDSFTVKHFAGEVTYQINGFLSKNNNSLQEDLTEVLMLTENVFLKHAMKGLTDFMNTIQQESAAVKSEPGYVPPAFELSSNVTAPAPEGQKGPISNRNSLSANKKMASSVTVSYQFRNQLDVLINTLRATDPHYIKCIKPNGEKKCNLFTPAVVMEQLRYSGALEVVRIRREGYPTRIPFQEFYDECKLVTRGRGWVPPGECSPEKAKEYVVILADELLRGKAKYQIGLTFIFLGDGALFLVHEAVVALLVVKAVRLQRAVRGFVRRSKFIRIVRCIRIMQRYLKLFVKRCRSLRIVQERWAREIALAIAKAEEEERQRLAEEARQEQLRLEQEAAALKARLEEERLLELEAQRLAQEARIAEEQARQRELEMKQNHKLEMMKILVRVVRKFLLMTRIRALHKACEAADAILVRKLIGQHPEDVFVLDKHNRFRSVYQSALRGGSIEVLKALGGTAADILSFVDLEKNGTFAVAAQTPYLSVFQFLGAVMDASLAEVQTDLGSDWNKEKSIALLTDKTNAPSTITNDIECQSPRLGSWILAAWMSKRKEKHEWKRRWCELTPTEIVYFVNESDALPKGVIPLQGCSVQRVHTTEPIFEVFSAHLVKKSFFGTSKRQSMLFLADNEEMVQRWMLCLRAVSGSIPVIRELTPNRFVHLGLRKQLCSFRNVHQETALHSLVKYAPNLKEASLPHSTLLNVLEVAAWLVEYGCDPLAVDSSGRTAGDLARTAGNIDLANMLSALQLPREVRSQSLLPPPLLLPGYSYMSISLQSHQFYNKSKSDSFVNCDNLRLCFSVTNSQNELMEPLQVIAKPVWINDTEVVWGVSWHMQTPLENMENELVIMVCLWQGIDTIASNTPRGLLTMDKKFVKSGPVSIPILKVKGKSDGLTDTFLKGEIMLRKYQE